MDMSMVLDRFALDWVVVIDHIITLGIAYVLALPIAYNREKSERTAGLRTFPLVAVAACGYMLTGFQLLSTSDGEARVIQGLLTGIGFIGGGAILKRDGGIVQGTATAASLWMTGAIGVSVAGGRLEIAVLLSLITVSTLLLLQPVKEEINGDDG